MSAMASQITETRLFVHQLTQNQTLTYNVTDPLCWESTSDRWLPKWQVTGKHTGALRGHGKNSFVSGPPRYCKCAPTYSS